jgi:hypothetical protein
MVEGAIVISLICLAIWLCLLPFILVVQIIRFPFVLGSRIAAGWTERKETALPLVPPPVPQSSSPPPVLRPPFEVPYSVVGGLGAIVAALILGGGAVLYLVSTGPPPTFAGVHAKPDLFVGTIGGSYGANWVVADGRKIENVLLVVPERGGIVTVDYKGGHEDISASHLPQGFLDEWKMTADVLKKRDAEPNPFIKQ